MHNGWVIGSGDRRLMICFFISSTYALLEKSMVWEEGWNDIEECIRLSLERKGSSKSDNFPLETFT